VAAASELTDPAKLAASYFSSERVPNPTFRTFDPRTQVVSNRMQCGGVWLRTAWRDKGDATHTSSKILLSAVGVVLPVDRAVVLCIRAQVETRYCEPTADYQMARRAERCDVLPLVPVRFAVD
jgi:hypothetical protein